MSASVLTRSQKLERAAILEEQIRRKMRRRIEAYYPDSGPLRREYYPKHTEFFEAGAKHNERCYIDGNRTGKSFCISYEGTCHLTGWYPH